MARPLKIGLDYFPHDTNACTNDKIEMLMSAHGSAGYTFYFILLEQIYQHGKSEIDVSSEEKCKRLARKIHITLPNFYKILKSSLETSLFNKEIYDQRKVLTSASIMRNCAEIERERERKRNFYNKDKEVLDVQNPGETPQSKVKKRKEKESSNPDNEFVTFWKLYDKSANKPGCLKKWLKLNPEEKQKIFETLPAYIEATPDKTYRKNPLTYLNGKCWDDEIISHIPKDQPGKPISLRLYGQN